MHELLNAFISKKENELKEKKEQEKNGLLLSKGLFEKVYSEDNTYDSEYCYSDWKDGKSYYYKKVPIEITDNEYEKLKELCEPSEIKEENATLATILKVIAWLIFIGGFIAGLIFGEEAGYYEFSFAVALIYWVVSFISGIFILGFAKIIELLNTIKNTLL